MAWAKLTFYWNLIQPNSFSTLSTSITFEHLVERGANDLTYFR